MTKLFLYLASRSARRRDYLKKMRIPFRTVPCAYRESSNSRACPQTTVLRHAMGKARNAKLPRARKNNGTEWVLGCDTVVFFRRRIIGKPRNLSEARKLLRKMSGKIHWVYTGLALIQRKTGRKLVGFEKTKVRLKTLNEQEIDHYIAHIDPLDKAGGYAIQKKPDIVASFKGSHSNVVGLPLSLLKKMLRLASIFSSRVG